MILIYIRVFFRYLKNQPLIAFVNIFSLGLGIAISLFLVKYILFELSYENFYKEKNNVYRVVMDSYHSGVYQSSSAATYTPISTIIKDRFKDINFATTIERGNGILVVDNNTFLEKNILAVNEDFFEIFPQEAILGNMDHISPNDIYISEKIAKKYFSNEDPIGKTIQVYSVNYTVKAVFKNLPSNTHLKFDIVQIVQPRPADDWNVAFMYTYIKLKGDAKKLDKSLMKLSGELSLLADSQTDVEYSFTLKLQPISQIHLTSDLLSELEINGNYQDVSIITIITFLMLLVSCMNYLGMTNATNAERIKETVVRTLHGASKISIAFQRFIESLCISLLGFVTSLILIIIYVTLIDPNFEFSLVEIDLMDFNVYGILLLILFMIVLVSSILTSIFYAIRNVPLLQDDNSNSSKIKMGFSRNLAFTQFLLSAILISVSFMVLKQVSFLRNTELGFNYSGVIVLETNPLSYRDNQSHFDKLKNDLESLAAIDHVSFSNAIPGEKLFGISIRRIDQAPQETQNTNVQLITSDYLETFDIQLANGRVFDEKNPNDDNSVLINETLAKLLTSGEMEEILEQEITADYMRRMVSFKIVGVVKDYFHDSKKVRTQPMLFIPLKNSLGVFRVSMKTEIKDTESYHVLGNNIKKAMTDNLLGPYSSRGVGVAYNIIDAKGIYTSQFRDEERFSRLLNTLTLLTIIMSAIGFFNLSSIVTRKRTKEVAIRKVHGASSSEMAFLMMRYFLGITGAAILFSLPISYLFVQGWLSNFQLQVELDIWFLFWPLTIILVLISISISYHLWKLIVLNPVKYLRRD